MRKLRFTELQILTALLFACVSAACATARPVGTSTAVDDTTWTPATEPVSAARLAVLSPGVNVTRWFRSPAAGETTAQFTSYLTDAALERMHTAGIRSIRLPFEPRVLIPSMDPDHPDSARVAFYAAAVDRILAHGMSVVVDMHPEGNDRDLSDHDGPYVRALARFWGMLARSLASRDAERVFFEVLNEPAYANRAAEWAVVEQRLVGAIRRAAPHHTIITSGIQWGNLEGLLPRAPLTDRDVIYTFHFYDSHTFTHQGATWMPAPYPALRNVPYPGIGAACDSAATAQTDASAQSYVRTYCTEGWGAAHIDERIGAAVAWAHRYGVPLYVGEFGAYCRYASPADRLQYLRDVRAALERHGIPWASWGWDDCFGLGAQRLADGTWRVDSASTIALGFDFTALR